MVRTRFLITASLAALLSLSGAAQAAASATVVIQAGTAPHHHARPMQPVHYQPPPPPPRHERAQAPRRGMLWSQGHWEWRGQRYAWVPGQWVRARHGQDYRQPRWEQRRGQWHHVAGDWNGRGPAHRYDGRPQHSYRH